MITSLALRRKPTISKEKKTFIDEKITEWTAYDTGMRPSVTFYCCGLNELGELPCDLNQVMDDEDVSIEDVNDEWQEGGVTDRSELTIEEIQSFYDIFVNNKVDTLIKMLTKEKFPTIFAVNNKEQSYFLNRFTEQIVKSKYRHCFDLKEFVSGSTRHPCTMIRYIPE